jgi:hypothetical protein
MPPLSLLVLHMYDIPLYAAPICMRKQTYFFMVGEGNTSTIT